MIILEALFFILFWWIAILLSANAVLWASGQLQERRWAREDRILYKIYKIPAYKP